MSDVQIRLIGQPHEITAIMQTLHTAGISVAWDGRTRPRRDGNCVSAYATITAAQAPQERR
ncbi:hypothetical protein [Nocardia sp. CA-120079]|uniref:hypothetical protein n=1 Tax=Nocardia sp. CA-120079 TaxID=3239974 RepID=UPI003D9A08C1